jgi:uracil-DNA glycosylase family 4
MYITASGRCAPPKNRPTAEELNNCQPYLEREIELIQPKVIVVLGRIAFGRILRIYSEPKKDKKFAHNAIFKLEAGPWLVCSYHPSQQNTSTGKLTVEMFDAMWQQVQTLMEKE